MLKISIVDRDRDRERRMLVEGKLTPPWVTELRSAWERAQIGLEGRELVVDFKNIIAISREGEDFLRDLLLKGAKVRSCGVFTRHILKQLSRRARKAIEETAR